MNNEISMNIFNQKQEMKTAMNAFKNISILLLCFIGLLLVLSLLKFAISITTLIVGFLIGAILSIVNIASLGFYIYKLILKQSKMSMLIYPVASFILMGIMGFLLHKSFWLISGFCLGLTTPVIIGLLLIFLIKKS